MLQGLKYCYNGTKSGSMALRGYEKPTYKSSSYMREISN